MKVRISEHQNISVSESQNERCRMRNNRRLLLSWITAPGLVGFGLLANWYLVFVLAAQPLETPNPYQQLYEDLLYPSVRITTSDGVGSGVIINLEVRSEKLEVGTKSNFQPLTSNLVYVLTAAHVVGNDVLVSVELFNSTESLPAFVVATDTGKDLALLQIPTSNFKHLTSNFKPARLAPRDYVPYIFTPVWVIGCSLGYAPRPSEGIITAVGGQKTENRVQILSDFWETNAPIWPGNSGGGVFLKSTHELIGIAVWVKVYRGQLVSTMAGVVTLQNIYEFLKEVKSYAKESD